jgi:hypothetical protein
MSAFCLIVEPVPLIARDLAVTARENLGFEPLVAASAGEALRMMENLDPAAHLSLAFVHEKAAAFASSALRPALEARGARIILLGANPGSGWPSRDWPALVWPFSTDQVLELIETLKTCRPGSAAC